MVHLRLVLVCFLMTRTDPELNQLELFHVKKFYTTLQYTRSQTMSSILHCTVVTVHNRKMSTTLAFSVHASNTVHNSAWYCTTRSQIMSTTLHGTVHNQTMSTTLAFSVHASNTVHNSTWYCTHFKQCLQLYMVLYTFQTLSTTLRGTVRALNNVHKSAWYCTQSNTRLSPK